MLKCNFFFLARGRKREEDKEAEASVLFLCWKKEQDCWPLIWLVLGEKKSSAKNPRHLHTKSKVVQAFLFTRVRTQVFLFKCLKQLQFSCRCSKYERFCFSYNWKQLFPSKVYSESCTLHWYIFPKMLRYWYHTRQNKAEDELFVSSFFIILICCFFFHLCLVWILIPHLLPAPLQMLAGSGPVLIPGARSVCPAFQ